MAPDSIPTLYLVIIHAFDVQSMLYKCDMCPPVECLNFPCLSLDIAMGLMNAYSHLQNTWNPHHTTKKAQLSSPGSVSLITQQQLDQYPQTNHHSTQKICP